MNKMHILALTLVPALAVACGGREGQPAAQAGQKAAAEQAAPKPAPGMMSITMASKGQSGITGTAMLTAAGSDSVQVNVSLKGVEQGKSYPTHVHHGTCAQEGAVAQPLTSVMGQADSTGTSTTTIANSVFVPDSSYFIQSHLPDGTPAACGDVPAEMHGTMPDSSSTGGGQ
jgi:hypothetical protein